MMIFQCFFRLKKWSSYTPIQKFTQIYWSAPFARESVIRWSSTLQLASCWELVVGLWQHDYVSWSIESAAPILQSGFNICSAFVNDSQLLWTLIPKIVLIPSITHILKQWPPFECSPLTGPLLMANVKQGASQSYCEPIQPQPSKAAYYKILIPEKETPWWPWNFSDKYSMFISALRSHKSITEYGSIQSVLSNSTGDQPVELYKPTKIA